MTGWAYCNVVESRFVRLSVPATKLFLLATLFGWSVAGGAWEGRRELRSAEILRDFATNLLQRWLLDWNVNFPMAIQAQTPSARWGGGSTAGGLKLAHHGFMPFQSVTAQDVIRCLELEVRVLVWGGTSTNGNYFIYTACKKTWTWSDKGLYYT